MKLEFESKAEVFVVENLTGRKVLDCDPVVLLYADLAALDGLITSVSLKRVTN